MESIIHYLDSIDFENTIKLWTLLIAAVGLGKALHEYIKSQRWKKAEFLAKEVKEFYSDENIQRALLMLDWNLVDIKLFEGEIEGKQQFQFTDAMLLNALKHHDETYFSEEEAIIRQTMDDFLFKLGMFQNYVDSKLIKIKDIKPYFEYWVNLIAKLDGKRKDEKCFIQLWKFISYYDYEPVIKLFKNFGFDIRQEKNFSQAGEIGYRSAGG